MEVTPALPENTFVAMQVTHFMAIAIGVFWVLAMLFTARAGYLRTQRAFELTLAALLVLQWPLHQWYYYITGTGNRDNLLPLHLCDIAAWIGAVALVTRKQSICELLYFWGLAGTLQGVITPALTQDYPNPRYFLFFILHLGVVCSALYVVFGLRRPPRASAKWTSWVAINLYAILIGGLNALLSTNYGFLCRKPETASLFDVLGPWPWYIGSASLLALVLFIVLDLPFMAARRRNSSR